MPWGASPPAVPLVHSRHPGSTTLPPPPWLQGDGTAHIFSGRRDVFTLSMHAASNFPARKQVRQAGRRPSSRDGSQQPGRGSWAGRRGAFQRHQAGKSHSSCRRLFPPAPL